MTDDGCAAPPLRRAIVAMACVMLAMFLAALSQTVVATTMPLIIADLGGFDRYTWAATSYMVTATLAYPIVGRLSDIYGRRLFLLLGLATFSAGSILLGFSGSMNQVVAYRIVQGAGGGAIMTCCYVAVADLFPPADRGRFHGLLSAVYGVSFVAGPILGGVLADALSWQWAFLLIGVAGVPVLLLTARVFPKPAAPAADRNLDPLGMIALALAVVPLLVALSSGGVLYEWRSPLVLGMLLFALVMIGVFVAIETRARSPLIPLSLYADPVVRVAVVVMLLASFGLYGGVLFLPLFFQATLGYSAAESGALLVPLLLGMVAGGVVTGQLLSGASAGGYRLQALACAGLMTAGLFLLSTLRAAPGVVLSQLYVVVAGVGAGGIVATLSIGVQNHVPFAIVGAATSALQFYRSIGGVLGLAVLGIVLATRFSSSLEQAVPAAVQVRLGAGRFENLQQDPRALLNSAAADGLRAELARAGFDDAATREVLAALAGALREALDSVFVVACIAAALALMFAWSFRVTVRPGEGDQESAARKQCR